MTLAELPKEDPLGIFPEIIIIYQHLVHSLFFFFKEKSVYILLVLQGQLLSGSRLFQVALSKISP